MRTRVTARSEDRERERGARNSATDRGGEPRSVAARVDLRFDSVIVTTTISGIRYFMLMSYIFFSFFVYNEGVFRTMHDRTRVRNWRISLSYSPYTYAILSLRRDCSLIPITFDVQILFSFADQTQYHVKYSRRRDLIYSPAAVANSNRVARLYLKCAQRR